MSLSGVCRHCGFVIVAEGAEWVTSISRGSRCALSPTLAHERPRGRAVVLCDSTSQGAVCDKPLDHKGVHRSWSSNVSWGTASELAESLSGDTR